MTIRETYDIIMNNYSQWDEISTISELKDFDFTYRLDLEGKRFFVGRDYKEPKAFGIYKDFDTEKVVVYKNKANGERAIRYEGMDEQFAVNQIKDKFIDELNNRLPSEADPVSGSSSDAIQTGKFFNIPVLILCIVGYFYYFSKLHVPGYIMGICSIFVVFGAFTIITHVASAIKIKSRHFISGTLVGFCLLFVLVPTIVMFITVHGNSYYRAGGRTYYHLKDDWYSYEDYSWYESDWDYDTYGDYRDYEIEEPDDVSSFYDSRYFDDWTDSYGSSDSDSSSDSSWDSDWDSGSTDWDSDW